MDYADRLRIAMETAEDMGLDPNDEFVLSDLMDVYSV